MTCYLRRPMLLYLPTERKSKHLEKAHLSVGIFKTTAKKSRIRIRKPVHGSKDPDPFQNVTDPEDWC
jgi:hypothetical protein